MSKDYILHFQPEIPQIIVAQEDSEKKPFILNVVKGCESIKLMDRLLGNDWYRTKDIIKENR